MFSDRFFPTFPYAEVSLLKRLRECAKVDFYMFNNDPRFSIPLTKSFYNNLNVKRIDKINEIKVTKKDLFVCGFDYKYYGGKGALMSKKIGATVFMYDVGGIDSTVREAPTHYFAAKGPWTKDRMKKTVGRRYKKIFNTGCIFFDNVKKPFDRDKFFNKYGLDKKKRLALLTPASPVEVGIQGRSITLEYTNILKEISKLSGWQVMIKGHPCDYHPLYKPSSSILSNRNFHYDGKSSWEKFAKGIKINVCDPQDGYDAIKASDVIVGITTSLALEIPMFYKPMICVNRGKYKINWEFDKKVMIDVSLNKLSNFLDKGAYRVNKVFYDRYINRHTMGNDGMSYKRVAGKIIKIADGNK